MYALTAQPGHSCRTPYSVTSHVNLNINTIATESNGGISKLLLTKQEVISDFFGLFSRKCPLCPWVTAVSASASNTQPDLHLTYTDSAFAIMLSDYAAGDAQWVWEAFVKDQSNILLTTFLKPAAWSHKSQLSGHNDQKLIDPCNGWKLMFYHICLLWNIKPESESLNSLVDFPFTFSSLRKCIFDGNRHLIDSVKSVKKYITGHCSDNSPRSGYDFSSMISSSTIKAVTLKGNILISYMAKLLEH